MENIIFHPKPGGFDHQEIDFQILGLSCVIKRAFVVYY